MKGEKHMLLSSLLTLFLVLSTTTIVHAPVTLPLLYIDPAENIANPTESFTINISVQDVTDLYSYGVKVGFNYHVLSFGGIAEGPFLEGQPGGTFFTFVVEFDHVNVVCATLGAYPGVSGSGTLFTLTFSVDDAGISTLDLFDDTLIDSTLTAIDHETADGSFYTSARANLVRKSAWPEHHHFVIWKDEDFNGTHANQTLRAKVKNLGPIDLLVQVRFEAVRDDGFVVSVYTEPLIVLPGTIEDVATNLLLTGADAGKYYVSAKAYYSWTGYYWTPGAKNKTFSFAVIP